VSGLVDDAFGLNGHMQLDALQRLLGEERLVSLVLLRLDPDGSQEIDARLKDMPQVAGVAYKSDALRLFQEQSAGMILTFTVIITLFAATITIGVVYNNARVVLSQRARDLASLRVLGFTRREISSILLGEMAVQVLLALPFGLLLGRLLVYGLSQTIDPETYRLPLIITPRSYAFAVVVAIAASLLSALLVRRRLDRLDLIAVLKTRE
jgi:putative ABC transport system permease protein